MWLFNRLLGFGLMFGGIGVLAKSIFITTGGFMIAAPTVIFCTIGILIIVYGGAISNWGWGVIGVGIVVTLSKAGIRVGSTTLFTFLLCFLAIASGFKLITRGRF